MNHRNSRYPESLAFRVPLGLRAIVQSEAARSHLAPPEFMRQVFLTGLSALALTATKGASGEFDRLDTGEGVVKSLWGS